MVKSESHLLTLPPEIRARIFELVLGDQIHVIPEVDCGYHERIDRLDPTVSKELRSYSEGDARPEPELSTGTIYSPLFCINQQIRREAVPLARRSSNYFLDASAEQSLRFLASLGSRGLERITHLHLGTNMLFALDFLDQVSNELPTQRNHELQPILCEFIRTRLPNLRTITLPAIATSDEFSACCYTTTSAAEILARQRIQTLRIWYPDNDPLPDSTGWLHLGPVLRASQRIDQILGRETPLEITEEKCDPLREWSHGYGYGYDETLTEPQGFVTIKKGTSEKNEFGASWKQRWATHTDVPHLL